MFVEVGVFMCVYVCMHARVSGSGRRLGLGCCACLFVFVCPVLVDEKYGLAGWMENLKHKPYHAKNRPSGQPGTLILGLTVCVCVCAVLLDEVQRLTALTEKLKKKLKHAKNELSMQVDAVKVQSMNTDGMEEQQTEVHDEKDVDRQPSTATVREIDGSIVIVDFPMELDGTDYIRRVGDY